MTWPTRRTSGAGTGIKSGPRRVPAYQDDYAPGKKSSDVGIQIGEFPGEVPIRTLHPSKPLPAGTAGAVVIYQLRNTVNCGRSGY